MGRLVQNHSTHVEGLIKWLRLLADMPGIKTITPGKLSNAKGRGEKLTLKKTIKTKEGYKLLARKGKMVQEVFVVTKLEENDLKYLIDRTNPYNSRRKYY